jgi:hypothetical protein
MQAKMDFCTHCMVNILQNVSNGQKVTLQHINHAMQAAYLTFYPGKTMMGTSLFHLPMGHFPHGLIYYVKGDSEEKASVVWCAAFYIHTTYGIVELQKTQHSSSIIKKLSNVSPSQIYSKLKIKEGEIKILLECFVVYPEGSSSRYFSDGRPCSQVSIREAFGFLLLSSQITSFRFRSIAIFTPKPGLFDETAPNT